MATTAFRSSPVQTVGELPSVGDDAPDFALTGTDLQDVNLPVDGKRTILNIFPSIDTGVCAKSVRRFNEIAAQLPNTHVVCVSMDLPFALGRFCGAEGIENLTVASAFRSTFGQDYGLLMKDGAMAGLLARSVVVVDEDGSVLYTELVPEITQEPDYDGAVDALK